jgi:transposase
MTTPTMAEQLVPDELWDAIQPLLPPKPPHPNGGRPWIEDRAVLGGIIYVLRAGVPWRLLPAKELGCGSGVTCWRRLRDWQQAGVWEQLHHRLLDWLGDDAQVDWSRAAIDSVSVRCGEGGSRRRESGRPGQARLQYHLLIDATGLPLAVGLSAANTHDSQLLEPMVDAVPAVIGPRGRPGRPRRRPAKLHGDKGYDYPTCRRMLRRRGIIPRIARRGVESTTRLGRHRWKVERSLAWLLANRRLTVRYERRADILTAFLHLACALICARRLQPL